MSYERGDVHVVTQAELREQWSWEPGDEEPQQSDARGDSVYPPVVILPHSCDYWVIGGAAEVRTMIEDLQAALRTLEAPDA